LWIIFFFSGIADTAQHGIEIFQEIISLRQEYEERILTLGSRAKNAHKLLRSMFAQPIVNANWATGELGMAFSSASFLLKSLTELGILKETTGFSRNRLFVLEKYLNLFRD
jgi:Fic family protein